MIKYVSMMGIIQLMYLFSYADFGVCILIYAASTTMHLNRATVFNCIVAVTFIALPLVSIDRNYAVSDAITVMWQFFN